MTSQTKKKIELTRSTHLQKMALQQNGSAQLYFQFSGSTSMTIETKDVLFRFECLEEALDPNIPNNSKQLHTLTNQYLVRMYRRFVLWPREVLPELIAKTNKSMFGCESQFVEIIERHQNKIGIWNLEFRKATKSPLIALFNHLNQVLCSLRRPLLKKLQNWSIAQQHFPIAIVMFQVDNIHKEIRFVLKTASTAATLRDQFAPTKSRAMLHRFYTTPRTCQWQPEQDASFFMKWISQNCFGGEPTNTTPCDASFLPLPKVFFYQTLEQGPHVFVFEREKQFYRVVHFELQSVFKHAVIAFRLVYGASAWYHGTNESPIHSVAVFQTTQAQIQTMAHKRFLTCPIVVDLPQKLAKATSLQRFRRTLFRFVSVHGMCQKN